MVDLSSSPGRILCPGLVEISIGRASGRAGQQFAGLVEFSGDGHGNRDRFPGNASEKRPGLVVLQDIIVFSERIESAIREQGWRGRIFVVPQQSDDGVLSALKQISMQS